MDDSFKRIMDEMLRQMFGSQFVPPRDTSRQGEFITKLTPAEEAVFAEFHARAAALKSEQRRIGMALERLHLEARENWERLSKKYAIRGDAYCEDGALYRGIK